MSVTYLHLLRVVAVLLLRRWHAHRVVLRWRRSWAVGSASWSRVVLRTSPRKTNPRVANWVALHLVDGHLGSVALNELDETAALSRWDLDVSDLAETLEEGAKLILGDVAGQTTNEDSGVVGVSELIHGLRGTIVSSHWGTTHLTTHLLWLTTIHARRHLRSTLVHALHLVWGAARLLLILRSRGGNAHGTITAVNTLHLRESTLLIRLIGEANKAVTSAHARDGIGHDLGGLARGESSIEQRHQDVLVDLRTKIANEDRELWATLLSKKQSV